jgi:cytochrome c biogenesis protein ResB
VDAWLEYQKGKFGLLTEPMYRAGLFNVVRAWWFLAALGLLVVSVCVCTANRLPGIWRNVSRPRERVPDGFFDRAANRVAFAAPQAAAGTDASSRLEALLRRRRFRVRRTTEGDTTYLFADRFSWAQLGTFLSHLALVLFLAGALVSRVGGFTSAMFVAEGATSPVFPVSHPDQMQVEVVDAVAGFDEAGSPLDYRTELVIYQGGREVARGVTTVNGPLSYGGYRFHQASYFGDGASLRVRDAATGNTVYRETLALGDLLPAPAVTVRNAEGVVLLDNVIMPTDFIEEAGGTLITVPGSAREFWVGLRQDEEGIWNLIVYDREDAEARFLVPSGESRTAGDLEWTFTEAVGLPYVMASGIPGDSERSMVLLSETPEGTPYLTVLGAVDSRALTLYPDEPVQIGDREYVFGGRREFAGIQARRDPGVNFIWVAAGLLLAGLMVTFYVPRLRLWARVRSGETVVAGLAERRGVFRSEVKLLANELGAPTDASQGGEMDA